MDIREFFRGNVWSYEKDKFKKIEPDYIYHNNTKYFPGFNFKDDLNQYIINCDKYIDNFINDYEKNIYTRIE
jgi:hypothetical protein